MAKIYDIMLSGSQMSDERFQYLTENVLVGGIKHRCYLKMIGYGSHLYSNAREDLKAAEEWLKKQGYEVRKFDRNRIICSKDGEYRFTLLDY